MAKLKAPLLSLGATGKLASTIVFSTWKGIKTAREYVVPSNPQTAAQTTQRSLFSDMVTSWRTYFTVAAMRTAWNLLAQVGSSVQSGFNAALSNMVKAASSDPDASFAYQSHAIAGNEIRFNMYNVDDGAGGDEAGNFEVWVGDAPDSLLLFASVAIAAGDVETGDLGDVDDIKYCKLRKGGFDRSGIVKHTLIA